MNLIPDEDFVFFKKRERKTNHTRNIGREVRPKIGEIRGILLLLATHACRNEWERARERERERDDRKSPKPYERLQGKGK